MGTDASPPSLPEGVAIERREATVIVRMERGKREVYAGAIAALSARRAQ